MKIIIRATLAFLVLPALAVGQNIKSPSEYLGSEVGRFFTYHHEVVDYFSHIADNSEYVSLQKYGITNERRDLLVAYISHPENLEKLGEIRDNNLRRTGLLSGQYADEDIAIVWLSYNVHGNEASSTETSMKVLYELVTQQRPAYNDWLKNMVVIIDPCMNPDGRERYVNWYNQVANAIPNPDVNTREHREGWAPGRTNHYLFDLNRDWVWQTQIESAQRMQIYQEWMPHVHVDFHEQGYNDNYYFAPAAQPMHEQITEWQRIFQQKIGENNAKYFDEKGWLYFTRERFDLLYPGYGDTYPTYNGAIGMTYEMAGHSLGGLAVRLENGDTLTLKDRIDRHFTTTISTLEACFNNRQELVSQFADYFRPLGKEMYVLKSGNLDRLIQLSELLDKNHIQFGTPKAGIRIKARAHLSSLEETITVGPGDLVVPLAQPKSKLAKVLMEKETRLVDSLTYDITAWSLPYAYGLEAYETKAQIELTEFSLPQYQQMSISQKPYAYLLNWKSIDDARFLSRALEMGMKANYFEKSFRFEGNEFNEGTLLFNRIENESISGGFHNMISQLAKELGQDLVPVYSGSAIGSIDLGSSKINFLKDPNILLLSGDGISTGNFGEIWHFFEQEIRKPINIMKKGMFSRIALDDYDILILASGSYPDLTDDKGFERIDGWVKNGGKLVLFDRAIDGFIGEQKFSLEKSEENEEADEAPRMYPFANEERENLSKYIQGGIVKVNMDKTHPLAFGYDDLYFTLKLGSEKYELLDEGWNVGYIASGNDAIAGFIGAESSKNLSDALVFGVENRGKGSVVYFVDNPLFRAFWQNGKLLVANAAFFDN